DERAHDSSHGAEKAEKRSHGRHDGEHRDALDEFASTLADLALEADLKRLHVRRAKSRARETGPGVRLGGPQLVSERDRPRENSVVCRRDVGISDRAYGLEAVRVRDLRAEYARHHLWVTELAGLLQDDRPGQEGEAGEDADDDQRPRREICEYGHWLGLLL